MAKRTRAGRKRGPTDREEPPQPLDEILALDNMMAPQKMPKDLADAAATPRATIYAPRGCDPKRIRKSREAEGVWELDLPEGAGVGIPGRKYGRLEDNNVAAGGAAMVNLVKWARSNWP